MTVERRYYSNGQPQNETPIRKGKLHGITKGWFKSGEIQYINYFLYGSVVAREEYRRHEMAEKILGL